MLSVLRVDNLGKFVWTSHTSPCHQKPLEGTTHRPDIPLTEKIGDGREVNPKAHDRGSVHVPGNNKVLDKIMQPTREKEEAKVWERVANKLDKLQLLIASAKKVWHHYLLLLYLHNQALEIRLGRKCSPLFQPRVRRQRICQLLW